MSKIDELTAFEASMAERACGLSMAVLAEDNTPKLGLLGALAWVHRKREEPTLKYDAYMQGVKANEVYDYLFDDDESAEVDEDGFLDPDQRPAGGDEEPAEAAGEGEGGVLSGDGGPTE